MVPVLMVPVVFGDAVELERHALGLALQLRIGMVLMSAWILDELATTRPTRLRISVRGRATS